MSSDSPGGDGKGGQDVDQNMANVMQMQAEMSGEALNPKYGQHAASAFGRGLMLTGPDPSQAAQDAYAQASGQTMQPGAGGMYGMGSELSALSDAVSDMRPEYDDAAFMNEYMDGVEDESYGGYDAPSSFYSLSALQKAEEDAEDSSSGFGGFLGRRYEPQFGEYDSPEGSVLGWNSKEVTTPGDVLTSPALGAATTVLGAPMALMGLASQANDAYNAPNKDDYTKDYDSWSERGRSFANSQYTPNNDASAFGGDNPPQQGPQYFPVNTTAPTQEEVAVNSPTDPRKYVKQYHSWGTADPNQFNLAPFVRRV